MYIRRYTHISIHTHIYVNRYMMDRSMWTYTSTNSVTRWRRPIGYLTFIGHFPQKRPMISRSFANNDLQLKASYRSSPPCTVRCSTYITLYSVTVRCSALQRVLQCIAACVPVCCSVCCSAL